MSHSSTALPLPPQRPLPPSPERRVSPPPSGTRRLSSDRSENFTSINWLSASDHQPRHSRHSLRGLGERFGRHPYAHHPHHATFNVSSAESDVFAMVGGTVSYLFEASQPWVAAALVGILCGAIASAVEIVTHWLTDLKMGVCTFDVWSSEYLCCLHDPTASLQGGRCDQFRYWGDVFLRPLSRGPTATDDTVTTRWAAAAVDVGAYVGISMLLAGIACWVCIHYAPYAAGSGITELKTILSGVRIHDYLSPRVLAVKCIGLCASVGSGLSLGKEGPFVHLGSCVGQLVASWFPLYRSSEAASRELISAAAAAGVAVAFGAPIGGVLFSLEEVSYFFPHRAMVQALVAAIVSTLVVLKLNATHTGRVVLFSVSYRHDFHWFELIPFAIIGVLGGVVGAILNSVNGSWCHIRKRSALRFHPLREVLAVALVTALINLSLPLLRGGMLSSLADLFDDCSGATTLSSGGDGSLCHDDETLVLWQLVAAAVLRMILTCFTFGLKVPAGCFVPPLFVGACLGRAVGIWAKAVVATHLPLSEMLQQSCGSHDAAKCVIPGVYAIVGAAAVLAGVTRMHISLVVIMFELTGGLDYIVPCMLVAITSKWIAELLGVPSIYEIHIALAGYPYLNTKEEFPYDTTLRSMLVTQMRQSGEAHNAGTAGMAFSSNLSPEGGGVREIGSSSTVVVLWSRMTLVELMHVVDEHSYQWLPVVQSEHDSTFLGVVSRIAVARRVTAGDSSHTPHTTVIHFSSARRAGAPLAGMASMGSSSSYSVAAAQPFDQSSSGNNSSRPKDETLGVLDWSDLCESCNVQATLDMSVQKAIHIFKALGNQHLVVVDSGRLVTLVTRRDMVNYLRSVKLSEGGARASLIRWVSSTATTTTTSGSATNTHSESTNAVALQEL